MHDAATRTAIRTFLREMAVTLQKASGVAKAADSLRSVATFARKPR